MTFHQRSIYVIASLTALFLLSTSVFASYRVVKQFEEKESRLKTERVYPEPEESAGEIEVELPLIEEEVIELPVVEERDKDSAEVKAVKNDSYSLGPDDIIRVSVLRHPEFSGDFRIEPNGYVCLPYLDPIKAEGLSKFQLRDKLAAFLSGFIEKPSVDVRIIEYNSQFIYVIGAVARPGRYSTQGKKMTVRDAITASGMPTRGASLRFAYIFSPDPNIPKKTVKLYDLLYRGKMEDNLIIKPGEIVYVRSTVISKLGIFLDQLLNPLQRATAINDIQDIY
ncbi:MAG: polysaccharide biosynthesis/export family protein [Candidatus Ratteibacteria bacterium]|nr:polysaccharide biosynthesis/export family protein [Candidatus Ratteibacteria bacterium]